VFNMTMQTSQVELLGITKNDVQEIFENALKDFKESKTRIIYLDCSYLYSFHLDDFPEVRKFNLLGRYYANRLRDLERKIRLRQKVDLIEYEIAKADNSRYCLEWHRCLEYWVDDKYVVLGGKKFKPIAISRSFDRVVNEGMEMLAKCIIGGGDTTFNFRAIGDGAISAASPSDVELVNEIDRIDVNDKPEGGSLSRDGSTIYSVSNHSKTVETPANNEFTECGIFNSSDLVTDKMLDHSVFDDPVPHTQNVDAPGSTTVIYMCSA